MRNTTRQPVRIESIKPLVRYVDEGQAVVEVQVTLSGSLPAGEEDAPVRRVEALVEVDSADGFHDEQTFKLDKNAKAPTLRFDLVRPRLWWPAGMGEQSLYELKVTLLVNRRASDEAVAALGLTSVRGRELNKGGELSVNGRSYRIEDVIAVDLRDEEAFLPVGGGSLLVVRGHYGPDVLYDAADRAGIMLVQCVPIDPEGLPENRIAAEVDRLAGHPSLAGWYVGHFGKMIERMAFCLGALDPSRSVFRRVPGL
jgi:Glycosyl hydrolases family 2